MSKSLIVYCNHPKKDGNNTISVPNVTGGIESFDTAIAFATTGKIDQYIHTKIIPKIKKSEFDVIFIKDNLSSTYLELYGITLAYHIRLSKEDLGDKCFVPIVIISDVDACLLNKFNPMCSILFTQNMFVIPNNKEKISTFLNKYKKNVNEKMDEKLFLSMITVESPRETSHDIANKWAIYRWAEFLHLKGGAIDDNKKSIFSMLYFKYLLAKNPINNDSTDLYCNYPIFGGRILFIDDESDKGWSDILDSYFKEIPHISFETFEKDLKTILINYYPDVVILDLRLLASEEDSEDIESFKSIEIRRFIENFNPGIQVIIFSATSKSIILEKLYSKYNILGYIKKEHPKDKNVSTKDSFDRLAELVSRGLEKKYLKDIWRIQRKTLGLEIFQNNKKEDKIGELKSSINSIFDVLNSNIPSPLIYAMLTIFKCIEIITYLYIEEEARKAKWIKEKILIQNTGYYENRREVNTSNLEHIKSENKKYYKGEGNISVENKIRTIMHKIGVTSDESHSQIKCIVCVRNKAIHQDKIYEDKEFCKKIVEKVLVKEDIITWFKMLQTILEAVSNDKTNKTRTL